MIFFTRIPSPLGCITLAGNETHLTGLWLEGQKYFPEMTGWEEMPQLPVFLQTKQWLLDYFSGSHPDPGSIPLAPAGTPFQMKVWQLLPEIPYGTVLSYGELARQLNCPSPQAVGGAVGRNPISIIIPCHRVVSRKGQLTGYAGGLARKEWLLKWEANNL